jgi:hypothetical protein|tara:strand:+ start:34271 stop:34579 length:309 start_codon:yes stop_codon:yes gene_type:complete
MPGSALLPALFFGLLLGVKHALDADHVVAVNRHCQSHQQPPPFNAGLNELGNKAYTYPFYCWAWSFGFQTDDPHQNGIIHGICRWIYSGSIGCADHKTAIRQ